MTERKNKRGIAETTRFCCVEEQGKELKKKKKKGVEFPEKVPLLVPCGYHISVYKAGP